MEKRQANKPQIRCVVCGKITAGRLPRASRHDVGDGTLWFPRHHKISGVDCPGNIEEGEDVTPSKAVLQAIEQTMKQVVEARRLLRSTTANWQEQCLFECDNVLSGIIALLDITRKETI